jgi:hypothetical protein
MKTLSSVRIYVRRKNKKRHIAYAFLRYIHTRARTLSSDISKYLGMLENSEVRTTFNIFFPKHIIQVCVFLNI